MDTINIETITIKTMGGYSAEITGIAPGSTDQLVGSVESLHGRLDVNWDVNGICRNQTQELNLDCQTSEIVETIALAKRLSRL